MCGEEGALSSVEEGGADALGCLGNPGGALDHEKTRTRAAIENLKLISRELEIENQSRDNLGCLGNPKRRFHKDCPAGERGGWRRGSSETGAGGGRTARKKEVGRVGGGKRREVRRWCEG